MPTRHRDDSASTGRRLRLSSRRILVGATALMTALTTAGGIAGSTAAQASPSDSWIGTSTPDLGANVLIFDPSMSTADIQAKVDAVSAAQVDNEMGTQRYSLLFKPGTYGTPTAPLDFQVGYYTEVAGLGASPTDVTINGHVDVYNRCLTPTNCIALDNFWRSISNLTINVSGLAGCRSSGDFWAVSQAAPMRRVNITGGNLTLMDYCTAGPQYASGGFISDSKTGFIINGSQQQFLVKDSNIGGWSNGVWNQVFAGTVGAPAQNFASPWNASQVYTNLPADLTSRERPYLTDDGSGNQAVFVPSVRQGAVDTSWASGPTAGTSIPIKKFYVAKPSDPAGKLNAALALGQNLLFTPGIYHLDSALQVRRPDTVLLGLGFATLIPTQGTSAIRVGDVPGVKLAGLLIDAGPVKSANLVEVGTQLTQLLPQNLRAQLSSANDPTTLSDVFFRIGGDIAGKAETALTVNSDNVLLDDIWAWRADHGLPGTVGWTVNTVNQGVVVNGNNVTATGLFVEHFQKYDVTWNGEGGKIAFFQNEMPYDAPNQAAWQHDGVNGFAAIHVDSHVKTFEGWGLGSYIFTNVDPTLHSASGFEVPVTPGVKLHDVLTLSIAAGFIDHIVNSTGGAVTPTDGVVPQTLVSFP
jgi:hypothetical protein